MSRQLCYTSDHQSLVLIVVWTLIGKPTRILRFLTAKHQNVVSFHGVLKADNSLAEGCWKLSSVALLCEVNLHLPVFWFRFVGEICQYVVLNQNLHSGKNSCFQEIADWHSVCLLSSSALAPDILAKSFGRETCSDTSSYIQPPLWLILSFSYSSYSLDMFWSTQTITEPA